MLKFFKNPFAVIGTRATIPATDPGTGEVNYPAGFPAQYQLPKTDPLSRNIERDRFNQLMFDVTNEMQLLQANGAPDFITTALNEGVPFEYGVGAIVRYDDGVNGPRLFESRVASNTDLPTVAASWRPLRPSGAPVAVAGGTADALTATFVPSLGLIPDGTLFLLRHAAANTGVATLNVNGTGAKSIVKANNVNLQAGDIPGAASWGIYAYDATLDKYVLLNASTAGIPVSQGNLLINGNFFINQRGYVSGAATSAPNQYTLDRWRVVTSGQSLVFAAAGNGNQITAPAGGVEQVVEGNGIEGGNYVLNWTGTATATVNGTPRTKGEVFVLPANTNATVRFIGGTVAKAQLELGSVVTPFQNRLVADELALCQRYYLSIPGVLRTQYAAAPLTTNIASVEFPVAMRVAPVVAVSNIGYTNGSGLTVGTTTPAAARFAASISSGGNMLVTFDMTASAEL